MKLLIKYNNKYICSDKNNEISYIEIPNYSSMSDFHNIDIFICLLCSNLLNDNYEASKGLNYEEGLEIFEMFDPECLKAIDFDTFFYNLDENLSYLSEDYQNKYKNNLKELPKNLVAYSYEELQKLSTKEKSNFQREEISEETPFLYRRATIRVNDNFKKSLESINIPRNKNDVLLMYSAGKDSTLAAIRLKNAGYNIHFIHFDNGSMLDNDKPFLTFKETFSNYPGYYFEFENHAVTIKKDFEEFFSKWVNANGNNLTDSSLDSEIRCLSCRMAMYTEAIKYAKNHGFKYIAEGARISQKFMIEQPVLINIFKKIASLYGIELLYPVLNLDDDFAEKEELIRNGFSSKSWEAKCLLGRSAKDKTETDKAEIINYYKENIEPKILKKISRYY